MLFRVAKWLKNVRFATLARSQMSSIVEVDTPRSRNSSNAAPKIRPRTSWLRTRGVELTFAEAPLNRRGAGRLDLDAARRSIEQNCGCCRVTSSGGSERRRRREAKGQRFWNSCLARSSPL